MDTKEQSLRKLEQLKQRTIEFVNRSASGLPLELRTQKDLYRQWSLIAREKLIKTERVRVQSDFRLAAVQGKYPVLVVEIVYASRGNDMRLLTLDFMVLAQQVGVCLLEVSRNSADDLLKSVYGEEFPDPDEPGHIVATWEAKEGLFSKKPSARSKYRNWTLPKLPGQPSVAEPHKTVQPPPMPIDVLGLGQLGQSIERGLVSHGKSLETVSENIAGIALLGKLFQMAAKK